MRQGRAVLRGAMAGIGAAGGLCLYALTELWRDGQLPDRALLALTVFGAVFFGTWLAMSGPLRPRGAAVGAALIGGALALLATLAGLRFDPVTDVAGAPWHVVAGLLIVLLAQPFWIAARRRHWSHYPTLFGESWSVVVRASAALMFTLVVWGVLYLSDALLGLVGIDLIDRLIEVEWVPFVLSGAVLGLALAVMTELADVVSPDLLLRLLRLLVPVLLVVMAVFLAALMLRGFDRLFGAFSVAGTLIAVAGAAVLLVSVAVDCDDAEGVAARPMVLATQALAALVVLPAGLAIWAIVLRVGDAGWTPARLAGLTLAALAAGYGLAYLWALAGGRAWRARLRAGNRAMALAILGVAALWLTPAFNAEAISARDQAARIETGRTPPERLDLYALQDWGRPGQRAIQRLHDLAAAQGREALAASLAAQSVDPATEDPVAARSRLAALMPVSPGDAVAARDAVIAALDPWEIDAWHAACALRLPDGGPACVLVVAAFQPETPGREALALFLTPEGRLHQEALVEGPPGTGWQRHGTLTVPGPGPAGEGAAILSALQKGPPVLQAVTQHGLPTAEGVLLIQP